MPVVKAPFEWKADGNIVVFLSGSIEMGKAMSWQDEISANIEDTDVTILNPRRDDWDDSWVQTIENNQFREQVQWELRGLEESGIICVCFDPNTKSPITLLELGLIVGMNKPVIVYCPEGFWRKGNVDILCNRYGIVQVSSMGEMISILQISIKKMRYMKRLPKTS